MAENVTTTLVVSLSSRAEETSIFKAEVDDRDTGLNNGDTSFAPGDNIGYLVFMSSNVDPTTFSQITSQGTINAQGTGAKQIDDMVQFAMETEATLDYPISGAFTYTWMGTNLGTVTQVNDRTLRIATAGVGVLKVSYSSNFSSYMLTNTLIAGEDEYDILIYLAAQTY